MDMVVEEAAMQEGTMPTRDGRGSKGAVVMMLREVGVL
jgi:hypothetical protein